MAKSEKVMTPEFRAAFVSVFSPTQVNGKGDAKFRLTMVFPKDADLSDLKRIAREAAVAKWGDKVGTFALRSPFRDGGEKAHLDGFDESVVFVTATTTTRPGVVDQGVKPIIDASEFYSGCYARATVNAFAYENSGNRGVSFGLHNVQKLRDGTPFSGRAKPEEDFEAVEGAAAPEAAAGDPLFD